MKDTSKVDEMFCTAMSLFNDHVNNGGKLSYPQKIYGYLSDELDDIVVMWYGDEPDGDQQLRAKERMESGDTMTEEDVIAILEHRIGTVMESITK